MKKTSAVFMLLTVAFMLLASPLSVFAQDAAAAPAAAAAPVPTSTLDVAPGKLDLAPMKVDAKGAVVTEKSADGKSDVPVAATVTPEIVSTNIKMAASFGNNAWVLASAALVFFMTIPGLALFYGGLVKKKNILSILMQSFAAMAIVSGFRRCGSARSCWVARRPR